MQNLPILETRSADQEAAAVDETGHSVPRIRTLLYVPQGTTRVAPGQEGGGGWVQGFTGHCGTEWSGKSKQVQLRRKLCFLTRGSRDRP